MRKFMSFISGVVLGAFTGGVAAILLAPASGSVLRSQFGKSILQVKDEIQQAALAKREELEKEMTDLRQNIIIK